VRERLKGGPAAADWYSVELLLREALTNAVLHGCAGDATRRVRCDVRVGARSVRLEVASDGPGFDWRAAMREGPSETATSGRGLKIYAAYADRVSFDETGNRLVLVRRLPGAGQEAGDAGSSNRADRR
jgi:anti-sigma regulatory factor (Ser/Thr protein kinase)